MEALFNENPSDIKYKLSHRAAFLLGLGGMDSIEIFNDLKYFYKERSNLVHGSGIIKYDSKRFRVLKYTRQSLLIFLILLSNNKRGKNRKKNRKGDLLKEIDYAMLDLGMRNSLKREINMGLKDFKSDILKQKKNGKYSVTIW